MNSEKNTPNPSDCKEPIMPHDNPIPNLENTEDISQRRAPSSADDSYLFLVAIVILILSVKGASFNSSCKSDGCIGIIFPVGGALIALSVQIFILIPLYAIKLSQTEEGTTTKVTWWVVGSIATFAIPMMFSMVF